MFFLRGDMGVIHWMPPAGNGHSEQADRRPDMERVREFVDGTPETVYVLFKGKRAVMFVNGDGANIGMRVNPDASEIYAEYAKSKGQVCPHHIYGPAIVLEEIPID